MNVFVETERLILRELVPEDVQGMFELDSDPEVHRYLGNNPITTKEQASDYISFVRQQYVENGIGRWAVVAKNSNAFMGWAGLKYIGEIINNHSNYYDVGYRFIKRYWGKGYATEAARATINYGFEVLKQEKLYAMTLSENKASRHVLERVGFNYVESFDYIGGRTDWFELEKR